MEHDLKEILSFIEPVPENYSAYSHRLYSLFIRACTEFEANCKSILSENNGKISGNQNINAYYKIHNYDKYRTINNFCVRLQLSIEIDLIPLNNWENDQGPDWYKDYNDVKHARVTKFSKANLKNVLNSVAAVYILLYARYENDALCQYQDAEMTHTNNDGYTYKENSLFKIKLLDKKEA